MALDSKFTFTKIKVSLKCNQNGSKRIRDQKYGVLLQDQQFYEQEGWLMNRLNDFSLYDWFTAKHPIIMCVPRLNDLNKVGGSASFKRNSDTSS